jgi:hypothetical protein
MKILSSTILLLMALVAHAHGQRVLIAYFDNLPERDDVISKLQGTGLLSGPIDSFNIGTSTPTLAQLSNYDSVFVFNCCNPINNATAFGNNLADYVDGGGGLVLAEFGLGAGGGPEGRWLTGGYHPFIKGDSGFVPAFDSIGTRHVPGHQVLDGVATFSMGNWTGSHNTRPKAPGAINIADWAGGSPLVVEMPGYDGRIIGLNVYPPSSSLDPRFWNTSTNGARLMANAVGYVARVPEPNTGILLAILAACAGFASRRCCHRAQ